MPTQLSPTAQGLMNDPYGRVFSGAPSFIQMLARILMPNPQIPLAFGSLVQPRGSLTSLVPKGGGEKGAPPVAMLREQLQQIVNSPIARDFGKAPDSFVPHLESFLPVMESKELRGLIDAYNSFLGVVEPNIQPARSIKGWTGPKRGTTKAGMSYPSSQDVEQFVDQLRGLYQSPFGDPR